MPAFVTTGSKVVVGSQIPAAAGATVRLLAILGVGMMTVIGVGLGFILMRGGLL